MACGSHSFLYVLKIKKEKLKVFIFIRNSKKNEIFFGNRPKSLPKYFKII
jgi:hypothetical protein